jgi:hypothetical protein
MPGDEDVVTRDDEVVSLRIEMNVASHDDCIRTNGGGPRIATTTTSVQVPTWEHRDLVIVKVR